MEVVEVPQADKQENIQLADDLDLPANLITQQIDHEMEGLDQAEQAKRDELAWS